MRLLFVSNYFPPEVNAPATRLHEHAKQWVADGHEVEVLTSNPHFPEGEIYDGYDNQVVREVVDGIPVTRLPMYVSANEGTVRRTLSYVSFMLSAALLHGKVRQRPDIVVATSPQFFCGIAGYLLAKRWGVPFVLEVRDLWPDSIVAVGAMERGPIIQMLETVEHFLYRQADHIVVVTDAFKQAICEKGIPESKISVIKNGARLERYDQPLDRNRLAHLRDEHDLKGKFAVSYIGTTGMAHRADILLEAAQRCDHPDIVFMVVGAGSEWDAIKQKADELNLPNFRILGKQPKSVVPYLLELSDVSLVHLKKSPLFETVLPSKIFEALAMGNPIILGVEGEAKALIEDAEAGITIEPEHADELAGAALRLYGDKEMYNAMSENAVSYVHEKHDRTKLARRYWEVLEKTEKQEIENRGRKSTADDGRLGF